MKISWLAVFRKEIKNYIYSLTSIIVIEIFLIISLWIFWDDFFVVNQTSLREFFTFLPWLFLILIPAFSMRLWSEEKRIGTIDILLSLPLSEYNLVLAKFAGALLFVFITLSFTFPLTVLVAFLGTLDVGVVMVSYLAAILLGGAMLSIGQYVSSITKNQIIAFIGSILVISIFIVLGLSFFVEAGGIISTITYQASLYTHYNNMIKGVVDIRDIVYFISIIVFFLYLNVLALRQYRIQ